MRKTNQRMKMQPYVAERNSFLKFSFISEAVVFLCCQRGREPLIFPIHLLIYSPSVYVGLLNFILSFHAATCAVLSLLPCHEFSLEGYIVTVTLFII